MKVGILYPGYSAEDDYPRLEEMLGGDVSLPLFHTALKSDDHTPEAMKAAGDPDVLADGARALKPQNLDSIIWACTSGSFAWGWDDARKQVEDLQKVAGVPASSTSFAFVDAAKHLELKKVSVAATYPENLALLFKTFLAKADIDVVQFASKGIFTASEVGASMGRDEVMAFAKSNNHPDAQAILIPDTAMHTVAWIDEIEKELGKPILTANQVSVWQGMKLAGGNLNRSGLGKLFSA
jgi:maleate cis-trans isomerase